MKKMKSFVVLCILQIDEGALLKSLFELRHFFTLWAAVVFGIATNEFVTAQISLTQFMLISLYAFVLMRVAYVFGIDDNATKELV